MYFFCLDAKESTLPYWRKLFYVVFFNGRQHRLSVWSIIRGWTCKQIVHEIGHFLVAQHLSVDDGRSTRQGRCKNCLHLFLNVISFFHSSMYHIPDQFYRVQPLYARRYAVDGIAAATQRAQIEAYCRQIFQYTSSTAASEAGNWIISGNNTPCDTPCFCRIWLI